MIVALSAVAHRVHTRLAGSKHPPRMGHVYQFLAAALGYNSYAAHTANGAEPKSFDDTAAMHVVLDPERLLLRQTALNFPDHPDPWNPAHPLPRLIRVIRDAFADVLPKAGIHEGQSDLEADIFNAVSVEIDESGEFASAQAETNAGGGDYDLEFVAPEELNVDADEWILEVSGTCTLEQDQDRVYHGHKIKVGARLAFPKLGRRILSVYETLDIEATVIDDYYDDAA